MTNPTVPDALTNVYHASVIVGKHVIIGAGSVILLGAKLEQGVAVGAMSLVASQCNEFTMCAGVPAKAIKKRSKNLLELEESFYKGINK